MSSNRLLSDAVLPLTETLGHVCFMLDTSTSMHHAPEVVPSFNGLLAQLGRQFPELTGSLYLVSGNVSLIGNNMPIESLPRLDPRRWHRGHDGYLKGGSALGDAFITACQEAIRMRAEEGYAGQLSVMMITDGYNRLDKNPLWLARESLEEARLQDVTIRLMGFIHRPYQHFLDKFQREVGLTPDEFMPVYYDHLRDLSEAVSSSMDELSRQVRITLTPEVVKTQVMRKDNHTLHS